MRQLCEPRGTGTAAVLAAVVAADVNAAADAGGDSGWAVESTRSFTVSSNTALI